MNFFKNLVSDIETTPEYFKFKHFPSFDGFRAISIILVVVFHMGLSHNYYYELIFNGSLGVRIFFVISGFLITTLLLKEKLLTGTISLRSFYFRRVLRILPSAYLFLLVVIILNELLSLGISYLYIVSTLLFINNFVFLDKYKSNYISHYWSLSVEEQFYLLFPFILKKNFKLYVFFLFFIIVILPLLFTFQSYITALNNRIVFAGTHYFIKFQGMAVGAMFSIFCYKRIITNNILKKHVFYTKVLITILIFSLNHSDDMSVLIIVYKNLLISILIGLLLVLNIFHTNDAYFKFLNLKVMAKIGVLSYTIYIWHLLILNPKIMPDFLTKFPLNIGVILIVSTAIYYLWEKPFLRLKHKYINTKTVAVKNED